MADAQDSAPLESAAAAGLRGAAGGPAAPTSSLAKPPPAKKQKTKQTGLWGNKTKEQKVAEENAAAWEAGCQRVHLWVNGVRFTYDDPVRGQEAACRALADACPSTGAVAGAAARSAAAEEEFVARATVNKAKNQNRLWNREWFFRKAPNGSRPQTDENKRDWLSYINDNDGAVCKVCTTWGTKAKTDSGFCSSVGSRSHTEQVLKIHEESDGHRLAARQQKMFELEANEVLPDSIEAGFNKKSELFRTGIEAKMRTAYFLAKNDMAVQKMEPLVNLQQANGAYMGESQYREDHAAYEFMSVMAKEISEAQIEAIKASPAFSLMVDESTDAGDRQHCIVYMM
jgi:hypothetical protein